MIEDPERVDPPFVADERPMLLAWLEYHRATLATKCLGLTQEQLCERSAPPSTLSLLGLVRHMAEVERGWFRNCLADEKTAPLYYSDDDPDGDFDGVAPATADTDLKTWRDECAHARELVEEAAGLDTIGRQERRGHPVSLRWIIVHMIEEYARHNGHADLLRQAIDGAVGD